MTGYIDNLRLLNRTERFHLLALALDNPELRLGDRFRIELSRATGLDVPADAFVAVDYRIPWLYAAAVMASAPNDGPYVTGGGIERGNPEDTDLLVAFDADGVSHVIAIEAKGVTGWSHKQLLAKALRLGDIFGFDARGDSFPAIQPHFVLTSPFQPADLEMEEWPLWMTGDNGEPAWLRLPVPAEFVRVVRTDGIGKPNANGGHWRPELDIVAERQALGEDRLR